MKKHSPGRPTLFQERQRHQGTRSVFQLITCPTQPLVYLEYPVTAFLKQYKHQVESGRHDQLPQSVEPAKPPDTTFSLPQSFLKYLLIRQKLLPYISQYFSHLQK